MALGSTGPNGDRERPAGTRRERGSLLDTGALSAFRIADALIDSRVILAWLLTFVGAPALVGLLVPVREGGAFLAGRLAGGTVRRSPDRRRIAGAALAGLAAFGISGAGLFLWGATAGYIILALLLAVALAAGTLVSSPSSTRPPPRPPRLPDVVGALALLLFGLVLAFGLGPRGALVIWAIMAAGGLWFLAALLFAAEGIWAAPTATAEPGQEAGAPDRRLAPLRALLVPAALAPPFLVALVSDNPGTGLVALGGLLVAAALAELVSGPLLRHAGRSPHTLLAAAAGLAAAALALAALADALGRLGTPLLLPILTFAVIAAASAPRCCIPARAPAVDSATGLAFLAGALLAPLSAVIGVRGVLLVLAATLLLAVPAALRLAPRDAGGA